MVGHPIKERIRTAEGVLRFRSEAGHVSRGCAEKRRERYREHVALGGLRQSLEKRQRSLVARHSAGLNRIRAASAASAYSARKPRFAATLEVHCELRCRDRHAGSALPLERGTDLAMELHARRDRSALIQHLAKQRVPECVGRLHHMSRLV